MPHCSAHKQGYKVFMILEDEVEKLPTGYSRKVRLNCIIAPLSNSF
jgi:hypothetical protein